MIKQSINLQMLETLLESKLRESNGELKKELKKEIETLLESKLRESNGELKKELKKEIDDLAASVNAFATDTEKRFSVLESDVRVIKSTMVTKPYLDEKLADLRGDFVLLARKGDNKLTTLVDVLTGKKVLTKSEQRRIVSMEPFPRSS